MQDYTAAQASPDGPLCFPPFPNRHWTSQFLSGLPSLRPLCSPASVPCPSVLGSPLSQAVNLSWVELGGLRGSICPISHGHSQEAGRGAPPATPQANIKVLAAIPHTRGLPCPLSSSAGEGTVGVSGRCPPCFLLLSTGDGDAQRPPLGEPSRGAVRSECPPRLSSQAGTGVSGPGAAEQRAGACRQFLAAGPVAPHTQQTAGQEPKGHLKQNCLFPRKKRTWGTPSCLCYFQKSTFQKSSQQG